MDQVAVIRNLVHEGRYRVRLHAVRHMIEEGFDENNMVEALAGRLSVLESYPEDARCLVLGHFHFTASTYCSLHIVCDLSRKSLLDVVSAYIPQRP